MYCSYVTSRRQPMALHGEELCPSRGPTFLSNPSFCRKCQHPALSPVLATVLSWGQQPWVWTVLLWSTEKRRRCLGTRVSVRAQEIHCLSETLCPSNTKRRLKIIRISIPSQWTCLYFSELLLVTYCLQQFSFLVSQHYAFEQLFYYSARSGLVRLLKKEWLSVAFISVAENRELG